MHLNGKNGKMLFNGRKLTRNRQMDRRLMLMENFSPWGTVCPCPGAIYMYMTIIFKQRNVSCVLMNPLQTFCACSKILMDHLCTYVVLLARACIFAFAKCFNGI